MAGAFDVQFAGQRLRAQVHVLGEQCHVFAPQGAAVLGLADPLAHAGGVYCVVAVKRVPGARMLEPAWRGRAAVSGASVPVAHRMPAQAVQGLGGGFCAPCNWAHNRRVCQAAPLGREGAGPGPPGRKPAKAPLCAFWARLAES